MSQYRTFTAQDAVEYARQFGGLDDPSSLVEAQEIGDGNLNLVFKIFDSAGVSRIVVKRWIALAWRRKPWSSITSTALSTR